MSAEPAAVAKVLKDFLAPLTPLFELKAEDFDRLAQRLRGMNVEIEKGTARLTEISQAQGKAEAKLANLGAGIEEAKGQAEAQLAAASQRAQEIIAEAETWANTVRGDGERYAKELVEKAKARAAEIEGMLSGAQEHLKKVAGVEMARYVTRLPVACTPNNGPPQMFGVGVKISDAASAVAGDVICDALALNPNPAMQALDQAGLNLILTRVDSGNWQHWFTSIVPG